MFEKAFFDFGGVFINSPFAAIGAAAAKALESSELRQRFAGLDESGKAVPDRFDRVLSRVPLAVGSGLVFVSLHGSGGDRRSQRCQTVCAGELPG